jgi:multimeric flavodoxin WrbA
MSSQMKTFFDRTSDLITIRKDLGRGLEGKETFLVSTGTQASLPEGFEVPLKRTSEYFNMKYRGHLYLSVKEEWCDETLRKFKDILYKEDQEDNKPRHGS